MADLISADRNLSHAELNERVRHAAGLLDAHGIGPGDAVAFMLRNDFAFFEVSLAAAMVGAYALPINWHFSAEEAAYLLEDSGAKLLVVHADLLTDLAAGIPPVPRYTVATPPEIAAAYSIPAERCRVPETESDWDTAVARARAFSGAPRPVPTTMLYTSGTTGKPKGVRRKPMDPAQQEAVKRIVGQTFAMRPGMRMLQVTPLYHAAPNAFAIAVARIEGLIVLMPRFDASMLLELIERHRITHTFMVPVMFVRLLRLPADARARRDLSSLERVTHGAAPCPPEVKRQMIQWWGPRIHEYYGASELGAIAACSSEEWLARPGTLGRLLPGAEAAIFDEAGRRLAAGEVGEIYARQTAYPDFTYHNRTSQRAQVERDGLITCGDVGYFDQDGYLYICDRRRDLVISGGVNIYPAEIEAALATMPGIADSAVFGIPDAEYGEALCACIQVLPGADVTAEAVRSYLRERLAAYKVPREVAFHASLPREDSGKIFKRKLRAPYWEGTGRSI